MNAGKPLSQDTVSSGVVTCSQVSYLGKCWVQFTTHFIREYPEKGAFPHSFPPLYGLIPEERN